MCKTAVVVFAFTVVFGACSQQDKQQTRQDLRKGGEAVKKELKNDAAFVKQEALKARAETQKGVKKLKKNLDSNSDSSR